MMEPEAMPHVEDAQPNQEHKIHIKLYSTYNIGPHYSHVPSSSISKPSKGLITPLYPFLVILLTIIPLYPRTLTDVPPQWHTAAKSINTKMYALPTGSPSYLSL